MGSQVWVVSTLLISIVLIVLTIVKLKFHPFLALLLASFFVGAMMGMGVLLTHTENGFGSIANILLIIGAGGAFNAILKSSGLADSLAVILSNLDMHPILLAWLVALILHAAVGSATVAMMGATAIVAPMLPLYPGVSPEIIAIAIGSGAIGCTIVTDSLFWLVKQYCGASLSETFKYYTTATFIASLLALAATFLLSFII
ncbi:GntT/GntP/DsdX family permease [Klebsiella quasipneumoniae subsp. similipneumoniae]|uniref:GntT/GntP/DsdX family permease n=1 Tax=Klebsiella quasipneumoniae TaxID=1463165 RepID=UPI00403B0514